MSKSELLRKLSIGSWIQIGHPAIAEIMASAGFDWLVVDLEHSCDYFARGRGSYTRN